MEDLWNVVIRAVGAILILFVFTRILGKKQISQLTFFEYVIGIVIGDLAGFMSTDIERHYLHGVVVMVIWFVIPYAAEKLTMKSRRLRAWLEGKGTVVIRNGTVLETNLGKERYTSDELMSKLRDKGVFNPADVEFAMLEPSGALSVLLKEKNLPLTPSAIGMKPKSKKPPQPVIMDGEVLEEGLQVLGYSTAWLQRELENLGHKRKDVFLGIADADGALFVDLYKDDLGKPKKRLIRSRAKS